MKHISTKAIHLMLGLSIILFWLWFLILHGEYTLNRPTEPVPEEGRIYSLNNHGSVTYLTYAEDVLRKTALWGATIWFLIVALIDTYVFRAKKLGYYRNRVEIPPE